MPIADKTFLEECDPYKLVDDFPYLAERFDALKEIRDETRDLRTISNWGRQVLRQHGSSMHRTLSIPYHLIDHSFKIFGQNWFLVPENLARFKRMYPEYKVSD